jgi:hypothetical protein
LRSDQDVNLLEEPFKVFLEFLEELVGLPVTGSNDFLYPRRRISKNLATEPIGS